MKNRRMLGTTLIIVMIILMGLSIAMIASVSFPRGYKEFKNNYYFVIRQFVWFGVGTGIFFFTSRFKYTWYAFVYTWAGISCSCSFFEGSKWSHKMVFIFRI